MYSRSLLLKVKIKSLAEEARIIRHFERKDNGFFFFELQAHRKGAVRRAARETLIAYAFIRGIPYKRVEENPRTKPNWTNIWKMAEKYGVCSGPREHHLDWYQIQQAMKNQKKRFLLWSGQKEI